VGFRAAFDQDPDMARIFRMSLGRLRKSQLANAKKNRYLCKRRFCSAVDIQLNEPLETTIAERRLPSRSESILGIPREPISLIVLAEDEGVF
jgi:hypothetical protein